MKAMRSTMNVSLPRDLKEWVTEQARSGGFGTASEYLRDVLRRARERQQRRMMDDSLEEAVTEGATVVMDDAEWKKLMKEARATARKSRRGAR
jgi:antitoxin ParD1/3/4